MLNPLLGIPAKLVFSIDLTYQLYIYQCIKQHNNNTTKTTTHDITWFTPSLGVMSTELCFIQCFTKTTVLIFALSCRSLQVLKAAHTAADFLNQPKPSAHTAAEVVHAHNWDLTFLQPSLSFTSIHLISKA